MIFDMLRFRFCRGAAGRQSKFRANRGEGYSHDMGSNSQREERVAIAIEAVLAGLGALQEILRRPDARVPVIKADGTPVTAGDLAVQMAIGAVLERCTPGVPVVGEEGESSVAGRDGEVLLGRAVDAVKNSMGSGAPRDPERYLGTRPQPNAPAWWTVDPIDGTKGFRSARHYALCLALVEGSRATVGVLSCPTLMIGHDPLEIGPDSQCGTVYYASVGAGAWKFAPHAGQSRAPDDPSRVVRPATTREAWLVCDSIEGSARAMRMRSVMDHTQLPWTSISLDSQCKYALVAEGAADCFMRVPGATRLECVWDHAPGAVVAAEAGATVCDLNGAALHFSGASLERNTGTLACDASIGQRVCAAARESGVC